MAGEPVALEPNRAAEPVLRSARFEDLIALAAEKRDLRSRLRWNAMCGWCASRTGSWKSACCRAQPKTLVGDLSRKLAAWTGRRWMVAVSSEAGRADGPRSKWKREKAELMRGVRADPLVQAVLRTVSRRRDRRRARRTEAAPEAVPGADMSPDPERED